MGMPAAAKKQVKEAEKLHAELYSVEEKPDEKTDTPEEPVEEVMQAEETPTAEKGQEQPVTAEPTPAEPAPIEETNWEHRYKSLQGKYNAEVPRLHDQIKDLQQAVIQLQSAPKPAPEPAAKEEETSQSLVTKTDIEDYGEDFIDVVRRVAQSEYAPIVSRLEKENEKLREQVGGVTTGLQQTARERLLAQLEARVPDWSTINNSDDFIGWLGHIDPYSGVKRHDMLLSAFEDNDVHRTIAFFEGYRNENAAVAPQPEPPRKTVPKVNMETLVSPGQAQSTGNSRAQEGSAKIWTQAEINKFYADSTAGKFRGKDSEKARIEREIFKAIKENRVQ